MSKDTSIKDIYTVIRASMRTIDMSAWEFERIRKYIEKHPKAERLPLPLLRRQAKLYWYIKDRKNDKNTSN